MTDIVALLEHNRIVKGVMLWSSIFGSVTYVKWETDEEAESGVRVLCIDMHSIIREFDRYGRYRYHNSYVSQECMLFPEQGVTWEELSQPIAPIERKFRFSSPIVGRFEPDTIEFRTFGIDDKQKDMVEELLFTNAVRSCGYHLARLDEKDAVEMERKLNKPEGYFTTPRANVRVYAFDSQNAHVGVVAVLLRA